jgi:hypothetical protein
MDLTRLLVAIANQDHKAAVDFLSATPSLAAARLARRDEFFPAERWAARVTGSLAGGDRVRGHLCGATFSGSATG